mmetsp:Transcript_109893/g.154064  ORF Transcript_109893/g.154064 Transcript_109893/m.154064 type:complete len:208 (+) Transcript_109893:167-790(+)
MGPPAPREGGARLFHDPLPRPLRARGQLPPRDARRRHRHHRGARPVPGHARDRRGGGGPSRHARGGLRRAHRDRAAPLLLRHVRRREVHLGGHAPRARLVLPPHHRAGQDPHPRLHPGRRQARRARLPGPRVAARALLAAMEPPHQRHGPARLLARVAADGRVGHVREARRGRQGRLHRLRLASRAPRRPADGREPTPGLIADACGL